MAELRAVLDTAPLVALATGSEQNLGPGASCYAADTDAEARRLFTSMEQAFFGHA